MGHPTEIDIDGQLLFLANAGEVGGLFKEIDWTTHPLGEPATWPYAVKSVLSALFHTRFPALAYVGDDLHCIYNDAFIPSLGEDGRHPRYLACPGRELFEEAWELIGPMIQKVKDGGEANYLKDLSVPIYRNGKVEETFWTFSHSRIMDEEGVIHGVLTICQETTDKILSQRRNETSERRFQGLADLIPHLIWISDDSGLRSANEALLDFSGMALAKMKGAGWLAMIHSDDKEETFVQWQKALESELPFEMEHRFRQHDGQYRWFLSKAKPHRDTDGNIDLWMGVSVDIHQIKEAEKNKDLFIGMASHELKTPVTTIKGYVDILRSVYGESEDEFMKNSLKTMDRQTDSLTRLISSMLDLSRMEMGKVQYESEQFDLCAMVRECVEDLLHLHPDHDISLEIGDVSDVVGDRHRLSQVIINFLTNAIKYAPNSQKVIVDVSMVDGEVEVGVKDFGIGLKEKDRKMVFKRFYRVEGKSQTDYSGFGIGLHIAADIIRRHGGEIGVESSYGEGSRFYFRIPHII